MVTVEEIEHVSKLMKIDVDDHSEYLEKVQTMISYFDILDYGGWRPRGLPPGSKQGKRAGFRQ